MSVLMYWRDRLKAKQPFYCPSLRKEQVTYKPNRQDENNTWPHSVHRETMYEDYLAWYGEEYLKPYVESGYYADCPDQLPQAVNELGFFTTIAPWVYIVGRKEQVRAYKVKGQDHYEGEWYETYKNKYFVRLCTWEQHIAAFELDTGIPTGLELTHYCPEQALVVKNAIEGFRAEIERNRILMKSSNIT